jgi:GT2 family glycosyltransferase
MEPRVLVLTVHYKAYEDCLQCMESLQNSSYRNWMHLVLDNASPDDSPQRLSSYFQIRGFPVLESSSLACDFPAFESGKTFLIRHPENRGFAAGNNEVLRYWKNRDCFIWLLNPDVRVSQNTMQLLVDALRENPAQVLGCSVYSWRNPEKYLHAGGFRINWFSGSVHPVMFCEDSCDYIYGASLFTHSRAFLDAGLFPEDYFLYWEESHWCLLARGKGYALRLISGAKVYDRVGGSTGRGFLAFYYYSRNGLRFMAKFRPGNARRIIALNVLRALFRWITFRPEAAKGIWVGTVDFIKEHNKTPA